MVKLPKKSRMKFDWNFDQKSQGRVKTGPLLGLKKGNRKAKYDPKLVQNCSRIPYTAIEQPILPYFQI